jgi:hypothetical protein
MLKAFDSHPRRNPMRTSTIVLISLTVATLGCAGRQDESSDLDTATAALVADNDDLETAEQDLEGGLELPLSGAASETAEIDPSSETVAATAAVTNAGLFFQPAGCITSTREGAVVVHVFDDCTGPHGRLHLTGTVTSTWAPTATGVSVTHATEGFQINGATVDHTVTITYSLEDGIVTRHRVGATTGATADGLPIEHAADYTTTWDPTTGCITRDGSSSTTLEGRSWSREIEGYERCGVGLLGCPRAGSIRLHRDRIDAEVQFNGGRSYDLTVNGHTFSDRQMLWCSPS